MDYKKEILKLLERIDNERILKMIYGFVKAGVKANLNA